MRRCARALHMRGGVGSWSPSPSSSHARHTRATQTCAAAHDGGTMADVAHASPTPWRGWEAELWPTADATATAKTSVAAACASPVATAAVRDAAMREQRAYGELFAHWPLDEEAPRGPFAQLAPALQARYILDRLAMAERRVHYAIECCQVDAMQQLERAMCMLRECESLLRDELHYMPAPLQARLQHIHALVARFHYEHDL